MGRYMRDAVSFVKNNQLFLLFVVKAIMSLWIAQTTEFAPDEHWQSTEVAYARVFGRGHMTWEWEQAIRSPIFPAIIEMIYKFGDLFGLITPFYLTVMPQLLVCIMSLVSMYCFNEYLKAEFDDRPRRFIMFMIGSNWFTTFCFARTIANQIEMNFICISLFLMYSREGILVNMTLIAVMIINFFIRPTSAIYWGTYILDILRILIFDEVLNVISATALVGMITLSFAVIHEINWYDQPVLTVWEFFKFNVISRGNAEFGTHSKWWYFYSGIPSIFAPLVLSIPMILRSPPSLLRLMFKISIYIAIFSSLDHKEIRFLLPIVPLLTIFLSALTIEIENEFRSDSPLPEDQARISKVAKGIAIGLVGLNIAAALVIGLHHQKGIKPAANFVYQKSLDMPFPRTWLMMPCYSLPTYTHLHHPRADFKFYTCIPKRYNGTMDYIIDDNFLQNNGFETVDIIGDIADKLQRSFPPHFVITIDKAASTVKYAFRRKGYFYAECARYRHAYVGDFHRFIVVLCASPLNLHGGKLGGFMRGT